jgi:hypothetical protein
MIDEHRSCVQNSIYRTGLLRSLTYRRRSYYCYLDNFRIYIHNEFAGKGLMEPMENSVCVVIAGCQLRRKVNKGT